MVTIGAYLYETSINITRLARTKSLTILISRLRVRLHCNAYHRLNEGTFHLQTLFDNCIIVTNR